MQRLRFLPFLPFLRVARSRAALLAALALAACGGGDAGSDASRQLAAPLVSTLELSPPTPWIDARVDFTAECSGYEPMRYDWAFGDGTTLADAGPSVSHAFKSGGTYAVRLTCTDANGHAQAMQRSVPVHGRDLSSTAFGDCWSERWGQAWCRQTPLVRGALYRELVSVGPDLLWGIGRYGTLTRSAGAGREIRWLQDVTAFAAASATHAWAATDGTVRFTRRGQSASWNWDDVWEHPVTPPTGPVSSLQAVSEQVVWALGGPDGARVVQRTLDGGQNWQPVQAAPDVGTPPRWLFARDALTAWVISDDVSTEATGSAVRMARTVDGGKTWEPVPLAPGLPVQSITAVGLNAERSVAWVATGALHLARLDLASGAWSEGIDVPLEAGSEVLSISAVGDDTVWLAGQGPPAAGRGHLLRLDDAAGQRIWRAFNVPAAEWRVRSVSAYTRDKAWAAGDYTLVHATLQRTSIESEWRGETDEALVAFSAANETHAWAVTDSGVVLRSESGGTEWIRPAARVAPGARDLLALDARRAWLLDAEGRLQQSADGGQTWQSAVALLPGLALALLRGDGTGHWIIGRQGMVLRSVNGDQAQELPCQLPADLEFGAGAAQGPTAWLLARPNDSEPSAGYTQLWHVSADGSVCEPVALDGLRELRTVAQPAAGEVWVVGPEGTDWGSALVWHSTDGGRSWTRGTLCCGVDAVAMAAAAGAGAWVATPQVVWKVEQRGAELLSRAQLWLEAELYPLLHLQAFDADTLWGAGASGQIWRTLTGGDTAQP